MRQSIDVKTTVRGSVPRIPFDAMARKVLGERYELSVVICGDKLATALNKKHREKSYSPNVLSFPLDRDAGEIFINTRKTEREARAYGVSVRERMALLFVHGLYHLKGLRHGLTMERAEHKTLRAFGLVN